MNPSKPDGRNASGTNYIKQGELNVNESSVNNRTTFTAPVCINALWFSWFWIGIWVLLKPNMKDWSTYCNRTKTAFALCFILTLQPLVYLLNGCVHLRVCPCIGSQLLSVLHGSFISSPLSQDGLRSSCPPPSPHRWSSDACSCCHR